MSAVVIPTPLAEACNMVGLGERAHSRNSERTE